MKPGNRGVLLYPQKELDDMVYLAHSKGMQVFLHAIGDAAINASIEAMEKSILANPRPHRHRINHVQVGNGELFERMAKLGIMADISTGLCGFRLGDGQRKARTGKA